MSENNEINNDIDIELIPLQMDCCSDELSPSQLAAYSKACQEHDDVINALTDLINTDDNSAEHNKFIPDSFQIYKLSRDLSRPSTPNDLQTNNNHYDDYGDQNVHAETSYGNPEYLNESPGNINSYFMPIIQGDAQIIHQQENMSTSYTIMESVEGNDTNIAIVPTINNNSINTSANNLIHPKVIPNTRISKPLIMDKHGNRPGGIIVNEVNTSSQNNHNGKVYPSLVVLAKPTLKQFNDADRAVLNATLILLLKADPVKFTKWLFQHKLIRTRQFCKTHPEVSLALESMSDTELMLDNSGYVWSGTCCSSSKLVSIYNGSIFKSKLHPHIILKLIYHWICQTSVQNILKWVVGVHSEYIKDFYGYLRSICTFALDKHIRIIGERNQQIELGIVSLGTKHRSYANASRETIRTHNVKVEILGVLDSVRNCIRLYALEPEPDDLKHSKILLILPKWVSKDCRLLCDSTINKNELHKMGYIYIIQTTNASGSANRCNANIMRYLHNNVSQMFRNTLWKLSRDIIQQFLDELVWRETFGNSPQIAFNNMVKHIAEKIEISVKATNPNVTTKKMSFEQKQKLVQLLEGYYKQFELLSNGNSSDNIRKFINWEHIKTVLNEIGPVERSAKTWRCSWSDIKRKVRSKLKTFEANNIKNNTNNSNLSILEIKIQHLMHINL